MANYTPEGSVALQGNNPENDGPAAYRNWKRFLLDLPMDCIREVPLYSDANISGERDDLGPYKLLNTLGALTGGCRAVLVIRASGHPPSGDAPVPNLKETDTTNYSGGTEFDELAAVIGLHLGIRLRCSTTTRIRFNNGEERPLAESPSSRPVLPYDPNKRSRLPRPRLDVKVSHDELLPTFPQLQSSDATALVRAARLYQDAHWIVDRQPNLAWLMLVSAVEVVAGQWFSTREEPVALLRQIKPDWVKMIEQEGTLKLLKFIAEEYALIAQSTKRFIQFVTDFRPSHPINRPPERWRIDWSESGLKTALGKLYKHRSKALHAGIPIPYPMCTLTPEFETWNAPAEVPFALGAAADGGIWAESDLPFSLPTFSYLVRGAILNWWRTAVGLE